MIGADLWIDSFGKINYWLPEESIEDIGVKNLLNLFNLWELSDSELTEGVENILWMNLSDINTISYINTLYQNAINLYQNTFLIQIKQPFIWKIFKDKKDVIDFLKSTSKFNKRTSRSQLYCDLVKIMFTYNEVQKYPQLKNAEEYANTFVKNNILSKIFNCWYFELKESKLEKKKVWEDYYETSWVYNKTMPGWWYKQINVTFRYRWKSQEKIIVKALSSEKWATKIQDLIKDWIGIEFQWENKLDTIYLLEYFHFLHAKNGNINQTDFRQKLSFYTEEQLANIANMDEISDEFKEFIEHRWCPCVQRKNGTNKYQDCKFTGYIETDDHQFIWLESRVTTKRNKNQSGLSCSKVVDGKKIRDAMIWLRWWVSDKYIDRLVETVSKSKKVEKDKGLIKEEYLKNTIRVTIPGLNRKIYSSAWKLEHIIVRAKDYPDYIVDAIRTHMPVKVSRQQIIEDTKTRIGNNI